MNVQLKTIANSYAEEFHSDAIYTATYLSTPKPTIPTGVENVQSDHVPCTKVIENGVLYIEKNGVRYNVQGQMVK